MTPENLEKWELIVRDVEKSKIPLEFIKKIVVKLEGRKQVTINIQRYFDEGLLLDEVEELVSRKLYDLEPIIVDLEFVLNLQSIANVVQPETDKLLDKLKS
jgi:hypothetical protein